MLSIIYLATLPYHATLVYLWHFYGILKGPLPLIMALNHLSIRYTLHFKWPLLIILERTTIGDGFRLPVKWGMGTITEEHTVQCWLQLHRAKGIVIQLSLCGF